MLTSIKNKNGYSLIEMFLVLMILLVFCITVFSLIFYGSDTYNKLVADKNNEADARIILSTFDMRLRQYDYQQGAALAEISWQNETIPVLRLSEWAQDGTPVHTWLFWYDGVLWESLTINGELPTPDNCQELLTNNNIEVNLSEEDKLVTISVSFPFSGHDREITNSIFLRS